MFNLVVLTGRICNDVELKYTQSNIPVCSFTLAVDRRVKSGEDKQTDFIPVVAWRQTAEFVSKYFQKGSAIGIEGSIQTRKYKDKDGNNRTAFEVIANNVQFIEPKRSEGNDGTLPSNNAKAPHNSNFGTNTEDFADIANEDMPF